MWNYINNCAGIISAITSAAALAISIVTYRISTQKPKLHLLWCVYLNGEGHVDGKGIVNFLSEESTVETAKKTVTICRPGGEMEFNIINTGKIAAKNVVLDIRFENMQYDDRNLSSRTGWKPIGQIHGLGLWQGIRWDPGADTVIHPGIPIKFQDFSFTGCTVAKNAKMYVTLSADNAVANVFSIPVEIE